MITARTWTQALISIVLSARIALATEPTLLPPVDSTVDRSAARDIVVFAAGSLTLSPPLGWQTHEIPHGREMRLVLTPGNVVPRRGMPADCIWITVRLNVHAPELNAEQIRAFLVQRIADAGGEVTSQVGPECFQLAGNLAWRQRFVHRVESESDGAGAGLVVGDHVLATTSWGIVEIQLRAPEQLIAIRMREWTAVLDSVAIDTPATTQGPVIERTIAAQPVLGSWRSYRGTMRLRSDGQIVIESDPPIIRPVDDAMSARAAPIVGQFESQGDLLFVQWNDGSKLNFRWRLEDDRLLLTDHEGKTTQLQRILQ